MQNSTREPYTPPRRLEKVSGAGPSSLVRKLRMALLAGSTVPSEEGLLKSQPSLGWREVHMERTSLSSESGSGLDIVVRV
jgi:hypothetical protein